MRGTKGINNDDDNDKTARRAIWQQGTLHDLVFCFLVANYYTDDERQGWGMARKMNSKDDKENTPSPLEQLGQGGHAPSQRGMARGMPWFFEFIIKTFLPPFQCRLLLVLTISLLACSIERLPSASPSPLPQRRTKTMTRRWTRGQRFNLVFYSTRYSWLLY